VQEHARLNGIAWEGSGKPPLKDFAAWSENCPEKSQKAKKICGRKGYISRKYRQTNQTGWI